MSLKEVLKLQKTPNFVDFAKSVQNDIESKMSSYPCIFLFRLVSWFINDYFPNKMWPMIWVISYTSFVSFSFLVCTPKKWKDINQCGFFQHTFQFLRTEKLLQNNYYVDLIRFNMNEWKNEAINIIIHYYIGP